MAHIGPRQTGLQGLSLRGVLNKQKKISSLTDAPDGAYLSHEDSTQEEIVTMHDPTLRLYFRGLQR